MNSATAGLGLTDRNGQSQSRSVRHRVIMSEYLGYHPNTAQMKPEAASPAPNPDASHDGGLPAYPRSFFRFLVLAFILVSSPLVVGLMALTIEADELGRRTERAMRSVPHVVEDVQAIQQCSAQIERLAQEWMASTKPEVLDPLGLLHERFDQTSKRLLNSRLPAQMAIGLRLAIANETLVRDDLLARRNWTGLPTELALMGRGLSALAEAGNAAAAQEIQEIREQTAATRVYTLVTLALAIPLAVLLSALFTVLLARPIAQIDRAIDRIGTGRLADLIRIGGPRDVRRLGRRLDWLRVRLLDLEAGRKLLSQSISHDLKTPLTSIYEGTDLLIQGVAGPLNLRQREIVQIMRESAQAMSSNIEGLLTVRSSSLRDAPVALQPVGLHNLIQGVVSHHQLSARAKGLSIQLEGPEMYLNGDREKLRIVFDNLLSNAIRFSPPYGRVLFALECMGDRARVAISDEGPGVRPENALQVFEPGFSDPSKATTGLPASGVGLTIAREFILAHGGQIEVASDGFAQRRRGAKFVIVLPGLTPPDTPRDLTHSPSGAQVGLGASDNSIDSRVSGSSSHA